MKNIFLLLVSFTFCANAQTKGIVKDSLTGQPIGYANIWIEKENIGTTTEKDGTFSLDVSKSDRIKFRK